MIDKILMNKFSGTAIFLLIAAAVFYLTFNLAGRFLSEMLQSIIDSFCMFLDMRMIEENVNPFVRSLVADGICPGVGSVLSFVPFIAVLFFCLSFLEETGYLSRAACLIDKPFRKIGLSGESAISMIMGFGCSVPAVISACGIQNRRVRFITVMLIPYMSCSAKLPVYVMFADAFFAEKRLMFISALYLTGVLTGVSAAVCMKRFAWLVPEDICLKNCTECGCPDSFCMLPEQWSLPSVRNMMSAVVRNSAAFVRKAFTVILAASVIIWLLENFDRNMHPVSSPELSLLADLGRFAAPFFAPLGFGSWQAASAAIAGLSAKEAVVSTLAVLTHSINGIPAEHVLSAVFTPVSAFSFCVFCLLYVPCVATLITVGSRIGKKTALLMMVSQCSAAWLVSFVFYNIIRCLGL